MLVKEADRSKKKGGSRYLFDHATWFKLVRVGQATDEASLSCPVEPHAFTLGTAEGGGFVSSGLWMVISGVWICWVVTRFSAEGGPTFFCFSVEKEIAQDSAGTPKEAISPAFDAALSLVEDKDGARCDHFPFRLYKPTSNAGDNTPSSGLEDEEGVACSFDPTLPRGLGPSLRSIIGVGHREE